MVTQDSKISSLYVLKALCAFGVVALHAPLGNATDFVRHIAGITVPVFFMITGYFLYSPDSQVVLSRIRKTILKVIPIIFFFQTFYYLLGPIQGSFADTYMLYFKWLILGQNPNGGHLWYLTALLEALVVLWLFVRWFGFSRIAVFVSCWLGLVVMGDYRLMLFGQPDSMMSANFIFYALPCISGGFVAAQYEKRLVSWLSRWDIVACIVVVLSYLNRFVVPCVSELLSTILSPWMRTAMIISIFLAALRYRQFGKSSCLETMGKDLSGNIYYWHGFFIWLLTDVSVIGYESFGAIYVLLLSVLVAYIVVVAQRKIISCPLRK